MANQDDQPWFGHDVSDVMSKGICRSLVVLDVEVEVLDGHKYSGES